MLDKLEAIKQKWEKIAEELTRPDAAQDMKRYSKLNKEYKDLKKIVDAYHHYRDLLSNIENNKRILQQEKDEDFRGMAKAELDTLAVELEKSEMLIKELLIPKDPADSQSAILEIRGGTGGDEAALFAGDLYRMYTRFAEDKGWKVEVMSQTAGTAGGFKEIIASMEGDDVYGTLKYESGVHRVQRVPDTETQGRIHTSAATVVVLPEAEELEVDVHEKDIKRDTFRSSGAGGQHVNKTESAVRLTHLPTGVVVECQQERSQLKNYERAMKVLRARIYEKKIQEQQQKQAQQRKTLVSTGDRSAKIRTYNYPQARVTDHRIGLTIHNLSAVMNGEIGPLLEALRVADNAEKLQAAGN